jgi:hypothetical protein
MDIRIGLKAFNIRALHRDHGEGLVFFCFARKSGEQESSPDTDRRRASGSLRTPDNIRNVLNRYEGLFVYVSYGLFQPVDLKVIDNKINDLLFVLGVASDGVH